MVQLWLATIAGNVAHGDTGSMRAHRVDFFVALETQVWDALASGDANADRTLLAADFVGVYPTGFADRSDHAAELVDGPSVGSYSITDARLISVSDSAVMLCYRADYRRLPGRLSARETMFVSSLWTQRDGQWSNVFSQDTPAAAPRVSAQRPSSAEALASRVRL